MRKRKFEGLSEEEHERQKKAAYILGATRSCNVKVKYDTEEQAHKAAMRKSKKWGAKLEAYPCPFCNSYHFGRMMSEEEIDKYVKIYDREYGYLGAKAPIQHEKAYG